MPDDDLLTGLVEESPKRRETRSRTLGGTNLRSYDPDSALDLISRYESGGRNIKQQVVPEGGGYNPSVGRVTGPSSASGPWQITNTTWRSRAPKDVLQKYPTAISAPVDVQRSVARKIFTETGFQDWAPYNAKLRAAIQRGEGLSGQTAQQPKPDDDLLSGLVDDDLASGIEQEAAPESDVISGTGRGAGMARAATTGLRGPGRQPKSDLDVLAASSARGIERAGVRGARQKPSARQPQLIDKTVPNMLDVLMTPDTSPAGQEREAIRQQVIKDRAARRGSYGQPTLEGAQRLFRQPVTSLLELAQPESANVAAETTERVEQARQLRRPEVQKLVGDYRRQIRSGAQAQNVIGGRGGQWSQETLAKAVSGLSGYLSGGLRAIADPHMSPVGALLTNEQKADQFAALVNTHALALQQAAEEEGADRNQASKLVQDAVAGTIASAPELAVMMTGVPAPLAFGAGGGLKSYGRGESPRQVGDVAATSALSAAPFEIATRGRGLTGVLKRAGTVGGGTAALGAVQGLPVEEIAKGSLTNALMSLPSGNRRSPLERRLAEIARQEGPRALEGELRAGQPDIPIDPPPSVPPEAGVPARPITPRSAEPINEDVAAAREGQVLREAEPDALVEPELIRAAREQRAAGLTSRTPVAETPPRRAEAIPERGFDDVPLTEAERAEIERDLARPPVDAVTVKPEAKEVEQGYRPPVVTSEELPIDSIIRNRKEDRGEDYLEGLAKSGKGDAPITVVRNENGELLLVDGHHRLELARKQGKSTIRADVSTIQERTPTVKPDIEPEPAVSLDDEVSNRINDHIRELRRLGEHPTMENERDLWMTVDDILSRPQDQAKLLADLDAVLTQDLQRARQQSIKEAPKAAEGYRGLNSLLEGEDLTPEVQAALDSLKGERPEQRGPTVGDAAKIALATPDSTLAQLNFGKETSLDVKKGVYKATTARGRDYSFDLHVYKMADGRERLVLSAGNPKELVDAGAIVRPVEGGVVIETIHGGETGFKNLGGILARQIHRRYGKIIPDTEAPLSPAGRKATEKLAARQPSAEQPWQISEDEYVRRGLFNDKTSPTEQQARAYHKRQVELARKRGEQIPEPVKTVEPQEGYQPNQSVEVFDVGTGRWRSATLVKKSGYQRRGSTTWDYVWNVVTPPKGSNLPEPSRGGGAAETLIRPTQATVKPDIEPEPAKMATAEKPEYREPPRYDEGSAADADVKRSTVSEDLIKSASTTASAYEQPAYIGGNKARLTESGIGDVASTKPIVSIKKPEYVLATVHPDGRVELEPNAYRVSPEPVKPVEQGERTDPFNAAVEKAKSLREGDTVVMSDGTRLTIREVTRNGDILWSSEDNLEQISLSSPDKFAAHFIPEEVTNRLGQREIDPGAVIETKTPVEQKKPESVTERPALTYNEAEVAATKAQQEYGRFGDVVNDLTARKKAADRAVEEMRIDSANLKARQAKHRTTKSGLIEKYGVSNAKELEALYSQRQADAADAAKVLESAKQKMAELGRTKDEAFEAWKQVPREAPTKPSKQTVPEPSSVPESKEAQKVQIAGSTYDLVRQNPDGTVTVKSEGGEFSTEPNEPFRILDAPSKRVVREALPATKKEFIRQEIERDQVRQQDRLDKAIAKINQEYQPKRPLPVGISKVQAIQTATRLPREMRRLVIEYEQAKAAMNVDTPLNREHYGNVYDNLKARESPSTPVSEAPAEVSTREERKAAQRERRKEFERPINEERLAQEQSERAREKLRGTQEYLDAERKIENSPALKRIGDAMLKTEVESELRELHNKWDEVVKRQMERDARSSTGEAPKPAVEPTTPEVRQIEPPASAYYRPMATERQRVLVKHPKARPVKIGEGEKYPIYAIREGRNEIGRGEGITAAWDDAASKIKKPAGSTTQEVPIKSSESASQPEVRPETFRKYVESQGHNWRELPKTPEGRKTIDRLRGEYESLPAAPPPEPAFIAKKRAARDARKKFKAEGGEVRGSGGPDTQAIINDLIVDGWDFYVKTKPKFDEWAAEMKRQYGEKVEPHLRRVYGQLVELSPKAKEEAKLPEVTSIKNEATEQLRRDLNQPELPAPERKSREETLNRALERGLDKKAEKLADEINAGERVGLTDEESMGVQHRMRELENQWEEINAKNPDDPKLEGIEDQLDSLTRASKAGGTEVARALAVRGSFIDREFKLVNVLKGLREAKGEKLTAKEKAEAASWIEEKKALEAKLAAAEERALQPQLTRETRRRERAQTRETLDKEAEQIKQQIAAAFQKARARRGVQPMGLAAIDPEGEIAKLLVKYASNRARAGGLTVTQWVDDAHALVRDEGWSRADVVEALSAKQARTPRSEEATRLANLKKELRDLQDAEAVASGELTATKQGPPKELFNKDVRRRAQIEKQIADLEGQMATQEFRPKQEREKPQYTRETYRLQKQLDEVRLKYEQAKYRFEKGKLGLVLDTGIGAANVPKTLLTIGDVSAVLRQAGLGWFTHPVDSLRALQDMATSRTAHGAANIEREIKANPYYELAQKHKVEFTGLDKVLKHREEGYLGSEVIDQISRGKINPLRFTLKPVKDFSERTFTTMLNSQRMRMFETEARQLQKMGLSKKELDQALDYVGSGINIMTGRGSIPKFIGGDAAAPFLNMAMFSPRLLSSRVQVLNRMFDPAAWAMMPKGARKIQMRNNIQILAGYAGLLGIAAGVGKATGGAVSVGLDPDDADFLKIKVGNTRFDTLTGLQQPMRFMIRMAKAIKGGETYSGEDAGKIFMDFARSKASPTAGQVWDAIEGQNRLSGKRFEAKNLPSELLLPLPYKDFQETIKEDGALKGTVEAIPSLLGVGVQSYKGVAEKPTTEAEKLARRFIIRGMGDDEGRTQEEIDRDAKKAELRARVRKGEDVTAELEAMKSKLTDRQVKAILGARNKTRLQEDFNRLDPKEAILVYSVATPEQRKELAELIEKKAALIDLRPPEQQEDLRKRYAEQGIIAGFGGRGSRGSRGERGSRAERR